jgi:hypothetical protein
MKHPVPWIVRIQFILGSLAALVAVITGLWRDFRSKKLYLFAFSLTLSPSAPSIGFAIAFFGPNRDFYSLSHL